jgi:hypothetical protein
MGWLDDAPQILGTDALPTAAVPDAGNASAATQSQGSEPGGINVPVGPAAQQPNQATGWGNLPPEIVAALRAGIRPPQQNNSGLLSSMFGLSPSGAAQFSSALGSGLASVGQNWNKPGGAAFAASAGAAKQGGNQAQQQQADSQLRAVHTAIEALKAGDMATYHQALANYHAALTQQRRFFPLAARPAALSNTAPPPQSPVPPRMAGQGAASLFAPPQIIYGSPISNAPASLPIGTSPAAGMPPPRPAADGSVDLLAQARDAITRGAPRDAVINRLRDNGIDPSGL